MHDVPPLETALNMAATCCGFLRADIRKAVTTETAKAVRWIHQHDAYAITSVRLVVSGHQFDVYADGQVSWVGPVPS